MGFFKCWCHPVSPQSIASHPPMTQPVQVLTPSLTNASALLLQKHYRQEKINLVTILDSKLISTMQNNWLPLTALGFTAKCFLARGRKKLKGRRMRKQWWGLGFLDVFVISLILWPKGLLVKIWMFIITLLKMPIRNETDTWHKSATAAKDKLCQKALIQKLRSKWMWSQ